MHRSESPELKLRTLHVAAPDVAGSAAGISDRLMSGVVETAVALAQTPHGKSSRVLHARQRLGVRPPSLATLLQRRL